MSLYVMFSNENDEVETRTMSAIPRIGEFMNFVADGDYKNHRKYNLHKVESIIWFPPEEFTHNLLNNYQSRPFDVLISLIRHPK